MPEIVVPYTPRPHFLGFHNRGQRFACLVAHRRAGKTVACVNDLITRAIYSKKKRPRYAYIAPQLKQAKKIAWEYLKEYTDGICDKVSESELWVRLKHNGAEICIYGADNPDSFRGQYFDGVVLDEYGDMSPSVWGKIILPTLADRRGWAVFIGTFKGKNHFYKIWRRSQGLDLSPGEEPEYFILNWFNQTLKASESRILSDEELKLQRSEQDEEEYQQEYECNPNAAVKGTYYAKILAQIDEQTRDQRAVYDPEFPVEVYSDLGVGDTTALWFVQSLPGAYLLIDYEEHGGQALGFYANLLREKPYKYSKIWLPHDAKARTFQTGRSTIELFLEEDKFDPLKRFDPRDTSPIIDICPKLDIQDGIQAVRKILPQCHFAPSQNTQDGVECLRAYKREWNEDTQVFREKPNHDWASNGSDAFRYFALKVKDRAKMRPENRPDEDPNRPKITMEQLWEEHDRRLKISRRHWT
jgi:phage terminase large subunit